MATSLKKERREWWKLKKGRAGLPGFEPPALEELSLSVPFCPFFALCSLLFRSTWRFMLPLIVLSCKYFFSTEMFAGQRSLFNSMWMRQGWTTTKDVKVSQESIFMIRLRREGMESSGEMTIGNVFIGKAWPYSCSHSLKQSSHSVSPCLPHAVLGRSWSLCQDGVGHHKMPLELARIGDFYCLISLPQF